MDIKERHILIITFPMAVGFFTGGLYGIYYNLAPKIIYDIMFGVGLLGLCVDFALTCILCCRPCRQ
jgi:hypothetical protein